MHPLSCFFLLEKRTSYPSASLSSVPGAPRTNDIMNLAIPEYVVSLILGHFKGDASSLDLCSRICRAFRAPCQRRLFSAVMLQDPDYGSTKLRGLFPKFLKLIQGSPYLGSYVEVLSINGICDIYARPLLDPLLLASMLSLLPNLKQLDITCVRLKPQPSDFAPNTPIPRPVIPLPRFNLNCLSLYGVGSEDDDTSGLCHVLNLFDTLKILKLHTNVFLRDCAREKAVFPSNLRVTDLMVFTRPDVAPKADFYYDFIRRTQSRKTLKFVSAECGNMADVAAVGKLLKQCGRNLSLIALCFNLTKADTVKGGECLFMR